MILEIARLKHEQKLLEHELVAMNKRLEATERRPEQMMALLHRVAEDPEILPRMMLEKNKRSKKLVDKERQRMLTPQAAVTVTSPSPSGINFKEEEKFGMFGGWGVSSPEGYYGNEPFWQSSPSSLPDVVSGGGYGYSSEADSRPPPAYPFSLLGGGYSNSF